MPLSPPVCTCSAMLRNGRRSLVPPHHDANPPGPLDHEPAPRVAGRRGEVGGLGEGAHPQQPRPPGGGPRPRALRAGLGRLGRRARVAVAAAEASSPSDDEHAAATASGANSASAATLALTRRSMATAAAGPPVRLRRRDHVHLTVVRALVTGATGFVGGRLARALADARRGGHGPGPRHRPRAGTWRRQGVELHEGDVLDAGLAAGRGRGRRRGLLPRARDGPRLQRRLRRSASATAAATSPGWPRRRASSGWSTSAASASPASKHLRSRHETGRDPRRRGPAAHLLPRRDGRGRRQRVLPDAALPGAAAAGDDRARLADHAHPADRRGRRGRLPGRSAAEAPDSAGREVQIGGPDVLSYGDMLDRMAGALGVRRRPKLAVPLLSPDALVALDRPRHAGRRRRGAAAGRGPVDGDGGHRPHRARSCSTWSPIGVDEALRRALAEDPA